MTRATILRAVALLPLLLPLHSGSSANAGLSFAFADAAGRFTNDFSVQGGETVQIQVFLVGDGSDATTLNDVGLLAAGVELRFSGVAPSPGTALLTEISQNSDFLPPLTPPSIDNGAGIAELALMADPLSPVFGRGGSVLLGTFTFQGVSLGTVRLTALEPSDFSLFLLGDLSTPTDPIGKTSADLRVVPAPPTILLGLIGAAAAAGRRRRVRS